MEVDERLKWLEARISSSLRPKGGDLRNLLADARNRAALLSFCNNSEARCLYVYLPSDAEGSIQISSRAPQIVTDKSIIFLKCYHAAKLNRENISSDVAYSECSKLPLEHLKLVTKEVYLPLLCAHHNSPVSADQLLDVMHRLLGAMQLTSGFVQNRVVLPIPSIEVLAEAATSDDRKPAIIRVLESAIIAWMKQVKMVLLMDPHVVITQMHGRYPQPVAELEFWESKLSKLVSLQDQLSTVVVLNILHNLERSHSTYAHAFLHVHREVGKAIADTELCLLYLNSLKPWVKQLADTHSIEALTCIFPPLMHLLFLTWQYSSMYCISDNFHRLLRFLANSVMLKAKETIGKSILEDPEEGQTNLRQALRICAAFRGCYLDYKEKADGLLKLCRAQSMEEGADHNSMSLSLSLLPPHAGLSLGMHPPPPGSLKALCPWPARNSSVFSSLNAIMERCNDLMELVQTVLHFREVELAVAGTAAGEGTTSCDPVMADIHADFTRCMDQFCRGTKDLLCLDDSGQSFEESFFLFRSTMRSLERRCSVALRTTFTLCPSLMAELRVLDMFQELIKRDAIKANLDSICQGIVAKNTPSVASKLLWLHALRERVNQPMGRLRSCAPQLLEGDTGWRLRQAVTDICRDIESHMVQTENAWIQSIPIGLPNKVKDAILSHSTDGLLRVNMDPTLWDVLHEATYLMAPPLCMSLPPHVRIVLSHADPRILRERVTLLQSVVQSYNQLREGLLEVDVQLFQSKLQSVDNLVSLGAQGITWNSPEFSEFIVKCRAAILKELATPLQVVHSHTRSIRAIVQAWSQAPNVDVFKGAVECRLEDLDKAHMRTLESLQHSLPLAMESIVTHVNQSFLAVDASHEAPAWVLYLNMVDEIVLEGLKALVLTAIGTLVERAQHYERGTSIPPLIQVDLELQGTEVLFSPPLTSTSASRSIPEAVQQWLSHYMDLSKLVRRVAHDSESCYAAISGDPEIKINFAKITAHVETCARQCQSLRKRFSIYEFLWEQDVQRTFHSFLIGQAAPHPRRFTRPETVRSRASARVHSGQSRSSTPPPPPSTEPQVTSSDSTLMGVMGVSDWEFLKPTGLEEKEGQSHPSLDDFDGELAVFEGVLERLWGIEETTAVGWLLVNQSPAKSALSSLASKWKTVYAGHLEQQVSRLLVSLEDFFIKTEPEVEGITGEETGTQAFMKLMEIFNKVNTQQAEMDTKFGALHRAVIMLDKFGHPLSGATRELFVGAPQRWSNLKKRVALGKQRIGPRIQASGSTISQDLQTFGDTFNALYRDFCSSACVLADCPNQEARTTIAHFERLLGALKLQARDLIELQELLETNIFNFSRLKEFEEELQTLKQVWNHTESVRKDHSQWKLQKWYSIDTAELQLAAERQLRVVNSVSKPWDIRLSVVKSIRDIQATLLMIDGLRSTAMRPRHWKQVLRYASSTHSSQHLGWGLLDMSELHELTLGQLVDLGLHNHSADVTQIVERANKDIAIESLLNNFEEVWLSKQLDLVLHTKPGMGGSHHDALSDLKLDRPSTSVTPKSRAPSARRRPRSSHASSRVSQSLSSGGVASISLLGHTAGVFEQLEHHQMSLQALMGTTAAAAFADDLSTWHKQFQSIETVLRTWMNVQQLWVQLEQVFTSSDIEQFLSSHAFIFAGVNKEWRELMVLTAKNPSIMQVCLRSDLLPLLEKMLAGLQKCQKALLQHMDNQRLQCPWFSFLPLEDILELICCGYDIQQLGQSLRKVIPFMSGLLVDSFAQQKEGAKSCKVTGLVSHHGEELDFMQDVMWDGAAETLVGGVVDQVSHTLQDQLARMAAEHSVQKPGEENPVSLSAALPPIWSSPEATQIVILYTQLVLDHALSHSTPSHGATMAQDLNTCILTAQQMLRGRDRPHPPPPRAHSRSDLIEVQSDQQLVPVPSEPNGLDEGEGPSSKPHPEQEDFLQPYMAARLQTIIQILVHYRNKVQHFLSSSGEGEVAQGAEPDLSRSFEWRCTPHFEWSPPTASSSPSLCSLACLDARVPYAYRYTGTSPRIMLTPSSERCLLFLMHTINCGSSPFVSGAETSDVLNEFALLTGHSLFTLVCTGQVIHTTVTEYLRGMVATNSWLHFQGLHALVPSVLQTLCSQLLHVHRARAARAVSVKLASYTLTLTPNAPTVCLASGDFAQLSASPLLPSSTFEVFKTFSMLPSDRKVATEGLLLAHQFKGASRLAGMLEKFWSGAEELFTRNALRPSEARIDLPCGHQVLRRIVALAERHLMEFEQMQGGGDVWEGSDQGSAVPSLQYSDGMRASLRLSLGGTIPHEDPSKTSGSSSRRTVEELSLLMAIKDCLLAAAPPNSLFRSALVRLMVDTFPSCLDLHALLDHEASLREELSTKQDVEGVESTRESRAASVMQMVTEDRHSTDDSQTIEVTIVQCCHVRQLSPTPEFQAAVIQLLAMVEAHPVVAVTGPSCAGKTQCIQVAADVLRNLGRVVTSYTVTCGAMKEAELFGFQDTKENVWTDGLLPQLLLRTNEASSTELGWFILDGELTSTQLDILTSFFTPDSTIKFSNGGRIPVTSSQRFIIEVPSLSSFNPALAAGIPRVYMGTRAVPWDAIAHKWLLAISKDNEQMSALSSICGRYVPSVLRRLAPVLLDGAECEQSGNHGDDSNRSTLEPQCQRYSSVHLTHSCCAILQCVLGEQAHPSVLQLELCFVYAVVWGYGGALNAPNKRKFDTWWRKEFASVPLPASGTLWDCYLVPGEDRFSFWASLDPPLSLSQGCNDDGGGPYVRTPRSEGLGHLVNALVGRGHPVLVEGPTGSGKTSLLREALSAPAVVKGAAADSHPQLLHVYATRLSDSSSLWAQLGGGLQWHWGRRYRPRGGKRLVCFIDDLHNAQVPFTSSASICELMRHHISTGGVLEPISSKWYSISDVSYVCTNSDSVATLSKRFLRHFIVLHWDGYSSNEMVDIFSHILRTLAPPTGLDAHFLSQLVHAAVEVHCKVQELFQPMPERVHYLFTMRHLAAVFRKLCLQPQKTPQDTLLLWQQESWWVYAGGMGSALDRERYHDMVHHVLRKIFSEDGTTPLILGKDSIRLPCELTEQLTAKLAHTIQEHNTLNPTLHVSLYQSTMEEIWRLSHLISSSHDIGHVMLIGHAYPDPIVQLSALNCGYVMVQPSYHRVPRPEVAHKPDMLTQVQEFRDSLLSIYTTAGLKNEKAVLFINTAELTDELFLVCVYEFVKDNGISAFFSDESQSKIISAIRSDLTQAGLQFDKDTAWSFFLGRVRKNVRVVLSVQSIPLALGSECRIWRELLNVMQIYYHQPWDSRQLVGVATHHLKAVQGLGDQDENVAYLLGTIHTVLRDKLGSASPQMGWDQTSNVMFEYFAERFVYELEKYLAVTQTQQARVLSSLECVGTAIAKVGSLEERVNREKMVLEEKSTACAKLLSQIGQDTAILKEHTKLLERQMTRIAHLNKVVPEYEHALELASEEIRLMVGQNQDLVLGMDERSLAELRALQRPSPELEELLAAVIMIVKSPSADTSWTKGAKRLMANLDRFRELLLQSSESEENSETILCALDPLLEKLSSSEPQLREKNPEAGLAAAQLCSWVQGMIRHHTGLQTRRRPLEVTVATMKASLNEYREKLKQQENKVKVIQERLEALGVSLTTASVEQMKQEEQVHSMIRELEQTQKFIEVLTPISEVWRGEETSLSNSLSRHLGLLMLGTALQLLVERGVAVRWEVPHPLSLYDYSTTDEGSHGYTYELLSACVLPFLCDKLTLVKWIAMGYNLPQLVQATLLLLSWKRWPLAFDKDRVALRMLRDHIGDSLVVLDWSSKVPPPPPLLQRLEHAMIAGEPVLLENVGPALDPVLQPVMVLARTRNNNAGLQVIKFCGRRLHVHQSFRLFLTTTLPPSHLHSSLANSALLVDLSLCEPMACKLLLGAAFNATQEGEDYRMVNQEALQERQRLMGMEEELFTLLESRSRSNTYWCSTEEFEERIRNRTEVLRRLGDLEVKLVDCKKALSSLRPLCSHCAQVYQLVTQASRGNLSVSWQSFLSWFQTWVGHQAEGMKENLELKDDVIKSFHKTVVQSSVSSLEHSHWLSLLVQLTILGHLVQTPDSTLWRDQLAYLASPGSVQVIHEPDHQPVQPQFIPAQLWGSLVSAPLSTEHLKRITSFPSFWEGLKADTVGIKASFPWRRSDEPLSLDDLVVTSLLNHEAFVTLLMDEVQALASSVPPETLSLTTIFSGLETQKAALLFLFDHTSITSQTSLWYLETELSNYLKTSHREVQVFFLGAGFEGDAPDSFSTSNADSVCAFIGDVQFASKQCLAWLPQWLQQGAQTVALTSSSSCALPLDFVQSSCPRDLARLTHHPLGQPPLLAPCLNAAHPTFHDSLLVLLSCIPEDLVARCDAFEGSAKPLVFHLAIFHAALHVRVASSSSSSSSASASSCPARPHFADFVSSLSLLIALCSGDPEPPSSSPEPPSSITHTLRSYLYGVYRKYCPPELLQGLLESCCGAAALGGGARAVVVVEVGGREVTVVVPSPDVPVSSYAEYAVGLRSHDQDRILLPDTTQVLDIVKALADKDTLSDVVDMSSSNASRIVHDLVSRFRELRPPLHLPEELVDARQHVEGLGTLPTCDTLPSAQLYYSYIHNKALEELSFILTVVMDDLCLLSQLPALNLPHPLVPVLQAILSGRMPSRWWSGPSITLDEGLNTLHKWHSTLSKNTK
ncbi:hypothetical protein EMCRGX_G011081 [Ephydatia muelleri]